MNLQENILRIKEVMGLLNEQQTTTTGYVLPQGHVEPTCTDAGCKGEYRGPQFLKSDDSDIAHKYSNTMSNYVGIKLKELYNRGIYVKVDLKNIVMTADPVQYGENYNQTHVTIDIPFIRVKNKCDAYTSFDHVGGWGHTHKINLSGRKSKLSSLLLPGETLDVSDLKMTHKNVNESLNEYWIQWKNIITQSDCANNSPTPNPSVNPTPKPNVNPVPKPQVSVGEVVTVTGNSGIVELRKKIIEKSSNASIDVKSISVDMSDYEISYRLGPTKINKISLFVRSKEDVNDDSGFTTKLNNIITQNKSDNLTVEIIEQGNIPNYPFNDGTKQYYTTVYWAVLLIT
jgi:hypothetical protein